MDEEFELISIVCIYKSTYYEIVMIINMIRLIHKHCGHCVIIKDKNAFQ